MSVIIGEIAEMVPVVYANDSNQRVNDVFNDDKRCLGIIVVENDVPIGLVTRTSFYQKLGSLYGYNLYIGRSIELLMKRNVLIVDHMSSIIDVSNLAMQREEEDLYDYVILTKYGLFVGVVSIGRLLMRLVEVQTEIASYLNPLTGLPGNRLIEEQLNDVLTKEEFSVIYIDIDNFKTYNDLYGFSKGDQVIKATSSLLQRWANKESGFLGHIGGDDFLLVLSNHNYEDNCVKVIREFENMLESYYSQEHLLHKFVYTEDRQGVKKKIPLLSLSIAVVTNQFQIFLNADDIVETAMKMKKTCKNKIGSCFVDC